MIDLTGKLRGARFIACHSPAACWAPYIRIHAFYPNLRRYSSERDLIAYLLALTIRRGLVNEEVFFRFLKY